MTSPTTNTVTDDMERVIRNTVVDIAKDWKAPQNMWFEIAVETGRRLSTHPHTGGREAVLEDAIEEALDFLSSPARVTAAQRIENAKISLSDALQKTQKETT